MTDDREPRDHTTDPPTGSILSPAQQRFRTNQLLRWRWLITAPALIDMAGLFSSYLIRPTSPTSTATAANSVVLSLDADYPGLWPTLFGAALLGLVVALVTARGLTAAHIAAFMVLIFYTVALAVTARLTHGGWATPSLAGGAAFAQFLFAQVYARLFWRPDRRGTR